MFLSEINSDRLPPLLLLLRKNPLKGVYSVKLYNDNKAAKISRSDLDM